MITDVTPKLVAKERAVLISQAIGSKAADPASVGAGRFANLPAPATAAQAPKEGADTTHLCVVDRAGNAVALTTTVNYGWGAAVVARGTGIVWNDQMDDFAIAPGVPNSYGVVGSTANAIAPGKVPLSSMSPTLVFSKGPDSDVYIVVGSPGGSRIPTTVAQIILNIVEYDVDVDRAVAAPRVHHQHVPAKISVEKLALEPATLSNLEARGHVFEQQDPWSNASAIVVDPATQRRTGAADPRGVGLAMAE